MLGERVNFELDLSNLPLDCAGYANNFYLNLSIDDSRMGLLAWRPRQPEYLSKPPLLLTKTNSTLSPVIDPSNQRAHNSIWKQQFNSEGLVSLQRSLSDASEANPTIKICLVVTVPEVVVLYQSNSHESNECMRRQQPLSLVGSIACIHGNKDFPVKVSNNFFIPVFTIFPTLWKVDYKEDGEYEIALTVSRCERLTEVIPWKRASST